MWLIITLNLNYECFMCHIILYLIHINFMQICIFKWLKCSYECFLVNMLSLKKPEVLVLLPLPSKISDECFLVNMLNLKKSEVLILLVFPGKIGWSGLPNRII
jgi:hypothetical protein